MQTKHTSDFALTLLAMHDHCQTLLGHSPLRADAMLLLFVASRDSISIKDAMHSCSLSNRAFYQMIDRLRGEGKIAIGIDEKDRRVHRITLAPSLQDVPEPLKRLVSTLGCSNNECSMNQPSRESA